VCDNDVFIAERQGGQDTLIHKRDLKQPRGNVYAAYAVVTLPSGRWRYELMDLEELHKVRAKSKSYGGRDNPTGPWASDANEMYKKTVVRRVLKMYAEDGALRRALERDDEEPDAED